ncbi:MAG: ankyrin repeat domain-containing protein [Puniceicoccales bacterium]|jgi:ankyrin repeat protein|nr:ankyrin repeat domain-containing protein [Puniceicoccales bacterium]
MKNKFSKFILCFFLSNMQISSAIELFSNLRLADFGQILQETIRQELTLEAQLFRAAFTGNIDTFKFLLEAGVDPNITDRHMKTPAMHVLFNEKILEKERPGITFEMINLLVKNKKFNPNLRDDMGNTVLHMAINFRSEKIAELLVKLPEMDINARGKFGDTALHLLSEKLLSMGSVIRALMARKDLDLTMENDRGNTARSLLESMKIKASLLVNTMDAMVKEKGESSPEENLRDAIIGDDPDEIQKLIREFTDLNVNWQDLKGQTLLMYAVAMGNFEVIQNILMLPDINLTLTDAAGKTALDYGKDNRNTRIINILKKAMESKRKN